MLVICRLKTEHRTMVLHNRTDFKMNPMSSYAEPSTVKNRPATILPARRSVGWKAALASLLLVFLGPAQVMAQSNRTSSIAINLNGVSYYSSEQPFLNIFKTANGWITSTKTTFDTGEEAGLFLDSNGYVTTMSGAHTYTKIQVLLLHNLPAPYYPGGKYVVLYDGEGTIVYGLNAAKDTAASKPGRDVLNVTTPNGISIAITATDPNGTGNYIRNIRVVQAAYEATLNSGQIFNPTFISRLAPFGAVRFMDWMSTNNSTQSEWANRPTPSKAFWGGSSGVPVEVMVALANQLDVDAWFNMPHLATDDYVTQFAMFVHAKLKPGLRTYVEYSNETWNYIFGQTTWIQNQGLALWPSAPSPFDANRSYYGMRAGQIMNIWKNAWGADSGRIVGVLAAQAANIYTAKQSLKCPLWSGAPCARYFDVIAIAPYFGYNIPNTWTSQPDGGLTSLFTEITQGGLSPGGYPGGMIKQAIDWAASYQSVASSYNLDLAAYEGGQTFVSSNDAALTRLYATANRDPRMGAAYAQYLQGWKGAGGHLLFHFVDASAYTKWGSWGALENIMATSSPKYDALTSFIGANPCWWAICAGSTNGGETNTPRPVTPASR